MKAVVRREDGRVLLLRRSGANKNFVGLWEWPGGKLDPGENFADVLLAQGDLAGALKAYRESLAVAARLAGADPSNAGWQRDLWVSYQNLGFATERSDPAESRQWWRKCYEQILSMKQRGILNSADEQFLEPARQKAGL